MDSQYECPPNKSDLSWINLTMEETVSERATGLFNSDKNNIASSEVVHLVIQRYRLCRILLDEKEWVTVGQQHQLPSLASQQQVGDETREQDVQGHCGLLVYVSFAADATKDRVQAAAQTVLNLPILTSGVWGDGTAEQASLLEFLMKQDRPHDDPVTKMSFSLVLCPQANLISTVRGSSPLKRRSVQYHGQISKSQGEILFHHFAACCIASLLEIQQKFRVDSSGECGQLPRLHQLWKQNHLENPITQQQQQQQLEQQRTVVKQFDPSIPSTDLFFNSMEYSAWDQNTGLPTHNAQGQPLTKSAVKKLKKLQDGHAKKHEKWLTQQKLQVQDDRLAKGMETTKQEVHSQLEADEKHQHGNGRGFGSNQNQNIPDDNEDDTTNNTSGKNDSDPLIYLEWKDELDPNFCQVVVGSYGKRQGLELFSDMGPFCHVLRI